MVHEATYAVAPPFLFQSRRPVPDYNHEAMRGLFNGRAQAVHGEQRTLEGFMRFTAMKLYCMLAFFYPATVMQAALLALPWILRRWWPRAATALLGGFATVVLFETWLYSHYLAPAFGVALLIEFEALRQLSVWRPRGRRLGRVFVWAIAFGWVAASVAGAANLVNADGMEHVRSLYHRRAEMVEELRREGGRHLILVRYTANHDPELEWVYNGADLRGNPVIWAREMGPARNRALLEAFRDRRPWLLEADERPLVLERYPMAAAAR
jgi:hypothetical protein